MRVGWPLIFPDDDLAEIKIDPRKQCMPRIIQAQGRAEGCQLAWSHCYRQGHWKGIHSLWDNRIGATHWNLEPQQSTLDTPGNNGRGNGRTRYAPYKRKIPKTQRYVKPERRIFNGSGNRQPFRQSTSRGLGRITLICQQAIHPHIQERAQYHLNALNAFCHEKRLQINQGKTKTMIFHTFMLTHQQAIFILLGGHVEVVDSDVYLGITFTKTSGCFSVIQTTKIDSLEDM